MKLLFFSGLLFTFLLVGLGSADAQAQTEAKSGQSQGSFQLPVFDVKTNQRVIGGTGLLAMAGPMKIWGLFVGAAEPFRPNPELLGYEWMAGAIRGGGEFGDEAFRSINGGDPMTMSLVSAFGSFTGKVRPLDADQTGWIGLTGYLGSTAGFSQMGTKNRYGTAYYARPMIGLTGGAVADVHLHPKVAIDAFVGYRVSTQGYSPVPEGSTESADLMVQKSPEFGGNIHVSLPYNLNLDLATMVNWMKQTDDNAMAKIYMLGLSWDLEPTAGQGAGVMP